MLAPRDSVPHFDVTSIDGTRICYSTLWQRKHLLLVTLPADRFREFRDYLGRLSSLTREITDLNAQLVVTVDVVPGMDQPGVLVADRWGEACFTAAAARPSELPDPDDLLDWVRYLQHQCPECQGEAR